MKRTWLSLAFLGVMGVSHAGCGSSSAGNGGSGGAGGATGVTTVVTCPSFCAAQNECNDTVFDCKVQCTVLPTLNVLGSCAALYDNLLACSGAEADPCATEGCSGLAETWAFCVATYCSAHPEDVGCAVLSDPGPTCGFAGEACEYGSDCCDYTCNTASNTCGCSANDGPCNTDDDCCESSCSGFEGTCNGGGA